MSPVVVEPWARVAQHGPGQRHRFFSDKVSFFFGAEGAEVIFSLFFLPHQNMCYNTFNSFMTIIVLFRSPIEVFLVP